MGMLRRVPQSPAVPALEAVLAADQLAGSHPAFVEFLCLTAWAEDGKPRTKGTVKVFYDDGMFKAFLNDLDQKRYCCVSADSLSGLLDVLEAVLTDDGVQWRSSSYTGKGGGKKS